MPRSKAGSAAFAQEMAQLRAEKRAVWDPGRLERVRRICMAYPEAVEVEQFGEPWWKAGKKPFCSYGAEGLRDGAAFNVSLMDQAELIKDPRFERTRYLGQHGWTTMAFGKKVDWGQVEELVDIAYRRVANKRMLAALDGGARGEAAPAETKRRPKAPA
jgi:predicted DNA-binding protein (MmcQ/YjbR family)